MEASFAAQDDALKSASAFVVAREHRTADAHGR